MSQVILERRLKELKAEREFAIKLTETHAKAMAGAMAGLAQSKKAGDGIAKYAKKLRFGGEEPEGEEKEKELPSSARVMAMFGPGQNGLVGGR